MENKIMRPNVPGEITCRKWTLFSLALAAILIQIIVMTVGVSLIKNQEKPANIKLTDQEWEEAKVIFA